MPTVNANGADIHFEAAGPEGAQPLVFCNALGATTAMWREQIAVLSRAYRCIAYDPNGHGRSAFEPKPPTIEALADDLLGVFDALKISRATLIAASIGAMTAISFAASYPGRVDRLVLIGATPKMPEPKIWTDRAAEARNDGLGKIADAAMQRWFTPAFADNNSERVDETRRAFVAVNQEAYARCCEAIAAMNLGEALTRISADTLVVAGAEDAGAPPAVAEAIRGKIAEAALLVVPRAAHMMVIERAAVLSGWISAFLGQAESG